jgi:hypothetical protein
VKKKGRVDLEEKGGLGLIFSDRIMRRNFISIVIIGTSGVLSTYMLAF